MIPKILHFCFGFSPTGGQWGLVHYACIKSAIERIDPQQAFLYFEHPPSGAFWDLTAKLVDFQEVSAPRTIFGRELTHYAHRADVFRLEKLIENGGIYLDCDVFVHRQFDDLLNNSVVLGQQEGGGLCNAVMLAEPGARFLRRWYGEYRSFRSKGHDRFWSEHSVTVPFKLAQAHPSELTILDPEAFFLPSWEREGLATLFGSNQPIGSGGAYANHLWESQAWLPYLCDLTPARVRRVESNFHSWIRPLIADLPDNFGARSFAAQTWSALSTSLARDHLRMIWWETSRRLKQNIRRALPVVRYRHQVIDRTLGIGARLTSKTLGLQRNLIADLHRRRTFQSVYREQLWGADNACNFFSGVGSRGEHVNKYVDIMIPLLLQHASDIPEELIVVDLGCGDFTIGSALLKSLKGIRYIGCDIVPELISHNQYQFGLKNIEFRRIDMVRDPLPGGHVCLLRQVLQHLSNAEIAAILPKLAKYNYVYVSEHQPLIREGMPNPDKPVGADIRFDWRTGHGRGVELDLPPWNLMLEEVIRSNSTGLIKGSIITYRVMISDRRGNHGSADRLGVAVSSRYQPS
jgi:hypothetical protein